MKLRESAIGYHNFQFWVPSGNRQQKVFVITDIWQSWRHPLGLLLLDRGQSRDFLSLLPGWLGLIENSATDQLSLTSGIFLEQAGCLGVPPDINVFSRRFLFWLVNICRLLILFPIQKPPYQPAQGFFTGQDIMTSLSEFHQDIAILFNLWIRFFYAPQRAQRTQRRRIEGMF